ncbi:MAG: type II toxin-antitoxin system Phd/YefM family antitoxin [Flavobacteriaceae bacterium]|jgi:antitoxin YefM|nr:type II toxin-antitoxin system Phd/YefM family antitoxin [Flavobacteriaceae bacterium]
MKTITQSKLRETIKESFDNVVSDNELLIVHRGKDKDVVVLSLEEYNSIIETFHLLKSGNNRKRLVESMEQAATGKTKKINLDEL